MPMPPRDIMPDETIRAPWLNELKRAIITDVRGDGKTIATQQSGNSVTISYIGQKTQPPPDGELRYQITAIANDYLEGRRIDDLTGDMVGDAVYIAKKETLRHDASQYPNVTTLTTVDADTVTMTDGSTTETAKVTPDWFVGAKIKVKRVTNGTGVSVGGVPVVLEEATGREWGVE